MGDSLKKVYKEGRKKSVFNTMPEEPIKRIREGAIEWSKENTVGKKTRYGGFRLLPELNRQVGSEW